MSTATATSQARIDANRANAQLSTGPKTEEGKQKSSANAVVYGFTAAKLYIRPEEQEIFNVLATELRFELTPDGVTEHLYFDQILHASWNIQRCAIVEAELQAEAAANGLLDAVLSDDEALIKKLDRIYRYKRMHESALARATNELRRIQSERVHRERLANSMPVPAPLATVLADTRSGADKIQNRTVARELPMRPENLLAYLHRARTERSLKAAEYLQDFHQEPSAA